MKTPLVDAPVQGRIVNPATGKSAQVELRPPVGIGHGQPGVRCRHCSCWACPLTDLPTLEVYRS
ncbi:hypothetical protein [Paracoccus sp. NBH48]|uniref:hypothetical protein n=1 Tax=Paracoccus sp. NBH48 TaxID=2596918 RepID=UPI002108345A|nr:hypothetical protein [Paracoccus sp. NBH48]